MVTTSSGGTPDASTHSASTVVSARTTSCHATHSSSAPEQTRPRRSPRRQRTIRRAARADGRTAAQPARRPLTIAARNEPPHRSLPTHALAAKPGSARRQRRSPRPPAMHRSAARGFLRRGRSGGREGVPRGRLPPPDRSPASGTRRRMPPAQAHHRLHTHRIASHRIASHRTASHRIASHRTAPHRTASHCIAPHRIARGQRRSHGFGLGPRARYAQDCARAPLPRLDRQRSARLSFPYAQAVLCVRAGGPRGRH